MVKIKQKRLHRVAIVFKIVARMFFVYKKNTRIFQRYFYLAFKLNIRASDNKSCAR